MIDKSLSTFPLTPMVGDVLLAAPGLGNTVSFIFHAGPEGVLSVDWHEAYTPTNLAAQHTIFPQLSRLPTEHALLRGGPSLPDAQTGYLSVIADGRDLIMPPGTSHTLLPHNLVFIGHALQSGAAANAPAANDEILTTGRIHFTRAIFALGLRMWEDQMLRREIAQGRWALKGGDPSFLLDIAPDRRFAAAQNLPTRLFYNA